MTKEFKYGEIWLDATDGETVMAIGVDEEFGEPSVVILVESSKYHGYGMQPMFVTDRQLRTSEWSLVE